MPPVGFEPKISAGWRPQAARLLRSWVRIKLDKVLYNRVTVHNTKKYREVPKQTFTPTLLHLTFLQVYIKYSLFQG